MFGLYRCTPTRLAAHWNVRARRLQSSLVPTHSIYISNSTNPYFNLSLEDWLFRHARADKPLLLLYRDARSIVIGRNQNPWKEVNMHTLRAMGVPYIRRRSGGGTVYHDLGNTNFSIHLPRSGFDRHATAQIILRAVRSLGIDANVNARNDICVGDEKMSFHRELYVSGSAYKIANRRAYHHGTMLISTELHTLGDVLRVNKDTMMTKGVASVRSPVCNLQMYKHNVTHAAFTNAVVHEFREEYTIHDDPHIVEENEDTLGIPYIQKGMSELSSWDWAYGQTPEFTYSLRRSFDWGEVNVEIRSKHGIILSCSIESPDTTLSQELSALGKTLEGKKYGFVDDSDIVHSESSSQRIDFWRWLQDEMLS